jgi:hypothetical protein
MALIKCCRRVFVATFLHVILGSTSHAEPILLAQLYHSAAPSDNPGETMQFSFVTYGGPGDEIRLSTTPTLADIGKTFVPDPSTLARFAEVLTTSTGGRVIDSGFGIVTPRHASVDEFFDGPFMGEIPPTHSPDTEAFIMNAYVPQLGRNFSGYRITQIEQTINGMSIIPANPTTSQYWGAQTIHIFGEQIPEPSTCVLVGIYLAMPSRRRRQFIEGTNK